MAGHAFPAGLLTIALALGLMVRAGAVDQPAGAEAPAPPAAKVAVDDWDWSSFSGLDDAPVIRKPQSAGWWKQKTFKSQSEVENARPDLDAPPRPAYAIFRDVPPFEVIPSERDADMHPCSNCHQWVLSDPRPRVLKKPHDNFELRHGLHGKGKFWCFTCHHLDGQGGLKTLEGEKLEFGDAYVLCSQCHVDQARDWVYGAHGKRASGWQGTRQVLNCTACHYQHRPALKARAPKDGPDVRMGLDRPAHWVARDKRTEPLHVREASWKREAEGGSRQRADTDNGGKRVGADERIEDGDS